MCGPSAVVNVRAIAHAHVANAEQKSLTIKWL